MTSGLNHGIKRSLPHLSGILVGFPLMIAAIGFGLGAIFIAYPSMHLVIKVVGTVYLLYLSYKIANAANPEANAEIKRPFTFLQAVAFQWVNPKAWVMAVGAIAAYTTEGEVLVGIALILVGYMSIGTACMLVWLTLGVGLQTFLKDQRHLRYFNRAMAGLLVLSVFSMILVELA